MHGKNKGTIRKTGMTDTSVVPGPVAMSRDHCIGSASVHSVRARKASALSVLSVSRVVDEAESCHSPSAAQRGSASRARCCCACKAATRARATRSEPNSACVRVSAARNECAHGTATTGVATDAVGLADASSWSVATGADELWPRPCEVARAQVNASRPDTRRVRSARAEAVASPRESSETTTPRV